MRHAIHHTRAWLCVAIAAFSLPAEAGRAGSPRLSEGRPAGVAQHLQDISVTIRAESSPGYGAQGSGVIKTRRMTLNGEDKAINFIWTAAHVVKGLRSVESVIDPKTGTERKVVKFKDVAIVQELREAGRRVGELRMAARVIRYSATEDLALLQVRKTGFVDVSVRFHLDAKIPPLGTDLYHVGSPGGQELGQNSMTPGIVSQIGRILDGEEFDQVTTPALPGSSGGGVFRRDGVLIGLLTQGVRGGDNFNYIVPARRICTWARRAKVEWAVDDSVPMPAPKALRALPVEDAGVSFSNGAPKPASGHKFLIQYLRAGRVVTEEREQPRPPGRGY